MKNFLLVEAPASRSEPFLLIYSSSDVTGSDREVEQFSRFTKWMPETKNYAYNTIKSYSERTALFLDFTFKVSKTKYVIDISHDVSQLLLRKPTIKFRLLGDRDGWDSLVLSGIRCLDDSDILQRTFLNDNLSLRQPSINVFKKIWRTKSWRVSKCLNAWWSYDRV